MVQKPICNFSIVILNIPFRFFLRTVPWWSIVLIDILILPYSNCMQICLTSYFFLSGLCVSVYILLKKKLSLVTSNLLSITRKVSKRLLTYMYFFEHMTRVIREFLVVVRMNLYFPYNRFEDFLLRPLKNSDNTIFFFFRIPSEIFTFGNYSLFNYSNW